MKHPMFLLLHLIDEAHFNERSGVDLNQSQPALYPRRRRSARSPSFRNTLVHFTHFHMDPVPEVCLCETVCES